MTEIRQVI